MTHDIRQTASRIRLAFAAAAALIAAFQATAPDYTAAHDHQQFAASTRAQLETR